MSLFDILSSYAAQVLTTGTRVVDLVWPSSVAAQLKPVLLPQRAILSEGICEDSHARIACLTTNALLPMALFTGMPVALSVMTESGTPRLFPMIVAEASISRSSTHDLYAVNLVGRDPLHFIGRKCRLRTWLNSTMQEVVSDVVSEWVQNSPLGGSFDFKFLVANSADYPKRACYIQHPDESDAQFVERLLRPNGFSWFWRIKDGADSANGLPILELAIFDSGLLLSPNAMPSVRYHRRDGVQAEQSIDTLMSVRRLTAAGGDLNSWDHEAGTLNTSSGVAGMDQGAAGNDLAQAMRSTRYAVDHLGDDAPDLDRLTQIQADNQTFRSQGLRGRSGIVTMSPGTYQVIEDFPAFEGAGADERTYTTISVEHVVENDLPAELHDAAQALIGDEGLPEWARAEDGIGTKSKSRYTNQFYCVPKSAPIVPSYVQERDAPMRRRLAGMVVSDGGGEVTCDELGRVKVRLFGGEPGADTTAWVRNPTPWGGKSHGYIGVLRAETEVGLDVIGPDRLVIAAVYFNGKTPPPQFDHLGGLPANLALSGFVSRELNGEGQQQLRFNDSPGSLSVQLGTDEAATQINIGALVTPMDQGKTELRGRGLEIRTDAAGALRTGESLLISTWKRLQAMGKVLDASEHQALMKDFADLFQGLGDYAGQHQGTAADMQPTTRLASDIHGGTEPTISITAPAGIASTTPRTIMSYAGVNIDSVAMQHYQLTAGGQFLMNAGKGASLFVHQGDLSAIAHHGKLLLQSQHNDTQIDAGKNFKVTAAGKMLFVADEITLMTKGGAYLSLKGGKVKIGGSEPLDINTDGHNWNGPATMSGDLPTFSDGDLGRTPRLVKPTDGKPAEGIQLKISRADDGDLSGQTDASGTGAKVTSNRFQRLKNIFFVPRS